MPYAIAGGNPAVPIKQRFSHEEIEILLSIRWWDWEIEKITRNIDVIMNGDIQKLKEAV